jgi:hypothetical protein
MLTPEQIEQLEAFDAHGARVLSVYLDLDPARQVERSYRVAFENLVKEAHDRLEEPLRGDLAREAAQVQAWLASQEPRGKGLALFSCMSQGLWRAYSLPFRVRDWLAFESTPDLALLLELVDEYERYGVALVDKEKARLFTVFMGGDRGERGLRGFRAWQTRPGRPVRGRPRRRRPAADAGRRWPGRRAALPVVGEASRRRRRKRAVTGDDNGLAHNWLAG